MKTAIIVPTYKRADMLTRLLLSLSKCTFPPGVEIVVVESGPQVGAPVCAEHSLGGRVRYLHLAIDGRAAALNHGIKSTDADLLIFFDDDLLFPPGILETYVDAGLRYGPGHIFGGPLLPDAEIECPPHLLPYLPRSATGWSYAKKETEIPKAEFSYFFGANWAVFRSDLMKVGLYAEHLGMSARGAASPAGDEVDLQQRLVSAGAKAIYLPGALIHHYVPRECYTLKWTWQRAFRSGLSEWRANPRRGEGRRELFGVPLWILKDVLELRAKASLMTFRGAPIEEIMKVKMRDAHMSGLLYGAWTTRSQPAFTDLQKVPQAEH